MKNQQIIISGVGGQGVLFITRLLAEAAIMKNLPVLTSETHGMAQRGGTVLSHLKAGDFSSPLISPGRADGLLALKAENIEGHSAFLEPGGWAVINSADNIDPAGNIRKFHVDADNIAQKTGNPRSVNLVVLGAALKNISGPDLYCSLEDIIGILEKRPGPGPFIKALEMGYSSVEK
ncbi:MAG: indolepyruvate oxidoreductase [bacterium]|nr:indolepyruvate oxidoreductase [bacterium]